MIPAVATLDLGSLVAFRMRKSFLSCLSAGLLVASPLTFPTMLPYRHPSMAITVVDTHAYSISFSPLPNFKNKLKFNWNLYLLTLARLMWSLNKDPNLPFETNVKRKWGPVMSHNLHGDQRGRECKCLTNTLLDLISSSRYGGPMHYGLP